MPAAWLPRPLVGPVPSAPWPTCPPSQVHQPSSPFKPLRGPTAVPFWKLQPPPGLPTSTRLLVKVHHAVRPSQLGRDPCRGRVQLPHPGAQRSRPRSVFRFLIIPEVLNIIAANLGGHRVRGLMTTAGSLDPSLDPRRKEWTEEGRQAWLSIRPSVHLSVSPPRLLKHGQSDP